MAREIVVVEHEAELAEAAAAHVAEVIRAAVARDGVCRLALAGGSTPRLLHGVLATDPRFHAVPWGQVDVFWGDERTVPPDHAESNYRMAFETLISKVPIDPARVYRVLAEDPDHQRAAARYEDTLRATFTVDTRDIPRFDLVLLGVGADGHTASLFPDSAAIHERQRLVVAAWSSAYQTWRITLTFPVLNAASQITFLVSGATKAAAVAAAIDPPADATAPPAAHVQPIDGNVTWLLDRAAAQHLSQVRP